MEVMRHYERLIEEENDPVLDPPLLRAYMDKWDGAPFWELLRLTKQQSVLEIGVGTGRLALRAAPCCAHLTGIDLSPKTIARAARHLAGMDNVELLCGDFLDYPFARSFDAVYSSLTFLHIREKRRAVQRVAALLRPGGRFVVSLDKNQSEWLPSGDGSLRVYPDAPEDMRAQLESAGFRVEPTQETEFAFLLAGEL